jgi:hypothetical protein
MRAVLMLVISWMILSPEIVTTAQAVHDHQPGAAWPDRVAGPEACSAWPARRSRCYSGWGDDPIDHL